MSVLGKKREANHCVNTEDHEDWVRYRVIAMVLSPFNPGTTFSFGSDNLDRKLESVLRNEEKPIIKDHFHFHHNYGYSEDLSRLLSCHMGYGSVIGLENLGPDFRYRITERTRRVAEESEKLKLFEKDDIEYLKSLGEKVRLARPGTY
ncbi:hypothetical protein KW805_02465 [Candidatus Pacearchaeota archaeon]|nr:hypothetical protein [Candidatus Pacearchaeota archaeon]